MSKRKPVKARPQTAMPPRGTPVAKTHLPVSRVSPLLPILLVGAAVVAYANGLAGAFIYDDHRAITDNPDIRALWPLSRLFRWTSPSALSGRPVVALSFAVNYALGGTSPVGFHLINVCIHVLNALLVFGLVRRALRSPRFGADLRAAADRIGFAAALLWTVHPLQAESVMYIVQRTELLGALFGLLTLYCALRGFESTKHIWWYAAAVGACALGAGSKETAAVAPVLVLLYDAIFVSSSTREALRRHAGLYAGLAATWLLTALVVASGARTTPPAARSIELTRWEYLLTQASVVLHYLRLAVWPAPLVIDYSDWPVAHSIRESLPAAAVVVAIVAASLWALWRRRPVGFLGAWIFCVLAPTSSVIPIQTEIVAERRMYLPLAAIMVGVVLAGHWIVQWIGSRRGTTTGIAIGGAMVLGLTAGSVWGTVRRNRDFASEAAIWQDAVRKRPDDAWAHNNLGDLLNRRGDVAGAEREYREASRSDPTFAAAHSNLGVVLAREGRTAESIEQYSEALRLSPRYATAHNNLGVALASQGRAAEAKTHYVEALRIRPDYADAHNNLGNVLRDEGRLEEARREFSEALRSEPRHARAHVGLAAVLAQLGQHEDALRHAEAAVQIDPNLQSAQRLLKELRAAPRS